MMFIRENRLPPIGRPEVVNRTVQLPPDMAQVLPFYTSRAPEHLPAPEPWPDPGESPVRFTRHALTMPEMPNTPAVSNLALVTLDTDKRLQLLGTDMRQGLVFVGQPGRADGALTILASIPHPSHVTLTDVDKDGMQDLLVADLGQFFPADHHDGAVIWLRGLGKGKFGAFWLDGWPRVADAEAADFNGDGRIDLAVAAFGWRKTGQVAILENKTTSPSQPAFTNHTIDPRTGAIHIIPVDLNHDGKMDFVTVLAQEHETVVAYINKGTGDFTFDQKVIYAAPHPNWGSSGIQLVDFDKDGDLDVLLTHGDTFDDGIVKPYHGIQWLENTGSYPFVEHTIAAMPGVHRALPSTWTATAISISSPARCSPMDPTSTRRRCRRWSGWSRRNQACSSVTRSRWGFPATPRWMSATSMGTGIQTSSSATSRSAHPWPRGWTCGSTTRRKAAPAAAAR